MLMRHYVPWLQVRERSHDRLRLKVRPPSAGMASAVLRARALYRSSSAAASMMPRPSTSTVLRLRCRVLLRPYETQIALSKNRQPQP